MGQSSTTLPKNADINHPTLKQCMISEVGHTMLFDCSVSNKAEYESWVAQLGKLYSEHPDTLLFPISYSYEGVGVCGEGGIVHIQYPLYALPLREELRKRADTSQYFTERELWYLLYSLVSACVAFKSLNKKVGDIQPLNIFVNQENGFVKVANACSWPGATTNYEKVIFQHQVAYLAPEEVKEAKQGRVDTQVDPYIAESFSIGVTMLEAALLRSSMNLYTQKKNCFSYSLLEKVLKEFKNLNIAKQKGSYSQELKAAIVGLCEISPEIRLTSEKIYKWLYPYHQPILNLNPFKPGFPPIQEQKSQPRISPLPYTTMTISKYKFGVQSSEVQSRIEKSSPKFMEEKKNSPESIKKYKPNLSNDDFLKHIDEQLRISKRTHK